jgi:phospholipid/cholesterol/gamma-HCH transport system permease protein
MKDIPGEERFIMSLPRNISSPDPFARLGRQVSSGLYNLGELTQLYYKSFTAVFKKTIFWENTLVQMELIGVKSLPIVLIISTFTGMVFSLQIAEIFASFGLTTQLGQGLTLAFFRELGPVLTGVVVAGRVGSSIAAEIGAMKVTEQIEALEALSTDPIDYLVAPRIIAAGLMLPILVVFADFVGVFAGFSAAVLGANVPPNDFKDGILTFVVFWDFMGGVLKAIFFGLVIAGIGTYKGLHTDNGAVGVGKSTTESVVTAMIIIFVLNYFLSLLFFNLG